MAKSQIHFIDVAELLESTELIQKAVDGDIRSAKQVLSNINQQTLDVLAEVTQGVDLMAALHENFETWPEDFISWRRVVEYALKVVDLIEAYNAIGTPTEGTMEDLASARDYVNKQRARWTEILDAIEDELVKFND